LTIRTGLFTLSALAGLGIVAVVATRTGLSLGAVAGLVPPRTHLLALGAFFLSLTARGGRIVLLARGLGRPLTLPGAVATQLTGEAAAALTPSRSGSDPGRLIFLRRLGVDVPTGIAVLAGELMSEGVVLLAALPFLLLLFPDQGAVLLGALPYAVGALALPFVAFFAARLPGGRMPSLLFRTVGFTSERRRRLGTGARRFRSKARALSRLDRATMAGVFLISLVHLLARLAILPILVLGATPDTPLGPLVAWPLLLLYTGSLLPPPGGGGGVELTFAAGLAGVLSRDGLAGSLLWWRWYTFYLGSLLGGMTIFLRLAEGGVPAPGLRRSPPAGKGKALPLSPGR
jgi:hypothetical protein